MTNFKIYADNKIVEINIYKTKWKMHAASIHYTKRNVLTATSHGCAGFCSRWWLTPHKPNKTVAFIMMSWDTLNIAILSHELLHAAVHLWTYEKEENGKTLSTKNDEEIAYIHSDLIENLLSMFKQEELQKLVTNN